MLKKNLSLCLIDFDLDSDSNSNKDCDVKLFVKVVIIGFNMVEVLLVRFLRFDSGTFVVRPHIRQLAQSFLFLFVRFFLCGFFGSICQLDLSSIIFICKFYIGIQNLLFAVVVRMRSIRLFYLIIFKITSNIESRIFHTANTLDAAALLLLTLDLLSFAVPIPTTTEP